MKKIFEKYLSIILIIVFLIVFIGLPLLEKYPTTYFDSYCDKNLQEQMDKEYFIWVGRCISNSVGIYPESYKGNLTCICINPHFREYQIKEKHLNVKDNWRFKIYDLLN